jgi:hypothetical protein
MKRFWRAVVAAGAATCAFLWAVPVAFAHEQRRVGAYQFTVGWQHEPTYVGEENGVQLFLHDAKGNPIDDIGSPPTLHVQVIFGTQTSPPLDLEASFDPDTGLGTHGEFDAAIIPTAAGNYTFHFFGSLGGQKIDERFTSGPATFNTVDDPTGIEFPTKVPNLPDLVALSGRLTPRVDHAAAAAAVGVSRANSAHTLGLIGVVLGALGLVAGVTLGGAAYLATRRRESPSRSSPTDPTSSDQ